MVEKTCDLTQKIRVHVSAAADDDTPGPLPGPFTVLVKAGDGTWAPEEDPAFSTEATFLALPSPAGVDTSFVVKSGTLTPETFVLHVTAPPPPPPPPPAGPVMTKVVLVTDDPIPQ
ncbi:MAG: hypothetical protein ABSD48_18215 [Armatimonadota bacterium]|jgi:hypothetical protein